MLLVDASVYIFRAYYALPDSLRGRDNRPLNAVYGFAGFLCNLLEQAASGPIAVAFDESLETSFRNELYPAYKANRETAPPELKAQMRDCQALVEALGIHALVSDRYEADDIIGTLVARATAPVTIVSSDKDLVQLLGDDDVLWDFARDVRLDGPAVQAKFGIRCEQMVDYLALMGDSVDNIPGVPGIGAKTAATLLQAMPSLDDIYADLSAVAALPLRGAKGIASKLEQGRESAFLSRELSTIVTDVPLPDAARDLSRKPVDPEVVASFCNALGIGEQLHQRLLAHASA